MEIVVALHCIRQIMVRQVIEVHQRSYMCEIIPVTINREHFTPSKMLIVSNKVSLTVRNGIVRVLMRLSCDSNWYCANQI